MMTTNFQIFEKEVLKFLTAMKIKFDREYEFWPFHDKEKNRYFGVATRDEQTGELFELYDEPFEIHQVERQRNKTIEEAESLRKDFLNRDKDAIMTYAKTEFLDRLSKALYPNEV